MSSPNRVSVAVISHLHTLFLMEIQTYGHINHHIISFFLNVTFATIAIPLVFIQLFKSLRSKNILYFPFGLSLNFIIDIHLSQKQCNTNGRRIISITNDWCNIWYKVKWGNQIAQGTINSGLDLHRAFGGLGHVIKLQSLLNQFYTN